MELPALRALPQPRRVAELTPEAQHYKSFRLQWKQKEASRVVALAFCPAAPHRLAVVSGTKVGLWQAGKGGEGEAASSVSKFKDLTQCAAWRSDGKLMLAGEAGGSCAVVEMETKKVLRRFRGHGDAVTCAAFASSDKTRAATGGRDGRLRIWDVATSELLQTVDAHADCLKVLSSGPGGPDAWITAGYDGKVKLWDLRIGGGATGTDGAMPAAASCCVAAADHGHPIEAGAAFPGGALFASAGGTEVKVWDMAGGGRLVQRLPDAHSKVITAVCLDSNAGVLLTASFDGFAKVHSAASLGHLWTYRLPGPATCAAWRPDGRAFAVGLDDGQWQMRQWRTPSGTAGEAAAPKQGQEEDGIGEEKPKLTRNQRAKREGHLRGLDSVPAEDDEVVEMDRPFKRREKQLDFFFRKYEYRKAVEFMFLPSTGPSLGLAIIDELLQRGALEASMSELGEALCLAGLRWLLKAFGAGDSLQQHLFLEALHTLLDGNRCLQPPCTPELVEAVARLENKVVQELRIQEVLMETGGMLKTVTSL